jgi:hypothetical protein
MKKQAPPLPPENATADMTRTRDLLDAEAQDAGIRQHHRGRLARLFRLHCANADDQYLLDLVTRYREVDPL